MPPSRKACEAIDKKLSAKAELKAQLEKVKANQSKAMKVWLAILGYGGNFLEALGADTIALIGSVSSQVAKSYLGALSSSISSIFERIFSSILKIVLAAPTVLLSLVAIPLDKAREAAADEKEYLTRAQGNLSTVLGVISKWATGPSGITYYDQIRRALIFINPAVAIAAEMVEAIANEDNATFSEAKYNEMISYIEKAIQATTPKSVIDDKLKISERLERNKARIYRELSRKIEDKYRDKDKAAFDTMQKDINDLKKWRNNTNEEYEYRPGRPERAVRESYIRQTYDETIKNNDFVKSNELSKAEVIAETQALRSIDKIFSNNDIGFAFSFDVGVLTGALTNLSKNVARAYSSYQQCRVYTNTVYDIRNMIKGLIDYLIALMRTTSNSSSAEVIEFALESAEDVLSIVQSDFTAAEKGFRENIDDWGQIKMSKTVANGNLRLIFAESLLDGGITQSLIDMVNADDILEVDADRLDAFIEELKKIPDWNGATGIWSVDLSSDESNPYIQLIADITTALATIPVLSLTGNNDETSRIRRITRNINQGFTKLSDHNRVVQKALKSYTPYMGLEAAKLKRILESAGLLDEFATGLSMYSVVTGLISTGSTYISGDYPNYRNCKKEYDDLFQNENQGKAALQDSFDEPIALSSNSKIKKAVDSESDRIEFEAKLRDLNFGRSMNEENGPAPRGDGLR